MNVCVCVEGGRVIRVCAFTYPPPVSPSSLPPYTPPSQTNDTHTSQQNKKKAREYYAETRDAKGALGLMPRYMTIEVAALRALDKHGSQVR